MVAIPRKDATIAILAVAILLIGTATGSAIALFVMSAITLLLVAVFYRRSSDAGLVLIALTTVVAAIITAVIIVLTGSA